MLTKSNRLLFYSSSQKKEGLIEFKISSCVLAIIWYAWSCTQQPVVQMSLFNLYSPEMGVVSGMKPNVHIFFVVLLFSLLMASVLRSHVMFIVIRLPRPQRLNGVIKTTKCPNTKRKIQFLCFSIPSRRITINDKAIASQTTRFPCFVGAPASTLKCTSPKGASGGVMVSKLD